MEKGLNLEQCKGNEVVIVVVVVGFGLTVVVARYDRVVNRS